MSKHEKSEFELGGNWGAPRGLYQETKYYGITIAKGIFLVVVFMVATQAQGTIFPNEQGLQFLLFLILVMCLAFYLILPSSAGGMNAWAILYFHTKRKRRYFSIDRNVYPKYQYEPRNNGKSLANKGRRYGR